MDESEYVDVEVIDLAKSTAQSEQRKEKYAIIRHRYSKLIPPMSHLLKTKPPSPTLKYLLVSNILTLIYLFRLHNGDLLESGSAPTQTLLSLLLSPDAHTLVTDLESAYYLFLKTIVSNDSTALPLLKMYEPQVLQDLESILRSKVDIVETLLR